MSMAVNRNRLALRRFFNPDAVSDFVWSHCFGFKRRDLRYFYDIGSELCHLRCWNLCACDHSTAVDEWSRQELLWRRFGLLWVVKYRNSFSLQRSYSVAFLCLSEQEIRPLTLAFSRHVLSGGHETISLFKKKTKTFLFWIKIPDDRGTQKLKYSEWKVA